MSLISRNGFVGVVVTLFVCVVGCSDPPPPPTGWNFTSPPPITEYGSAVPEYYPDVQINGTGPGGQTATVVSYTYENPPEGSENWTVEQKSAWLAELQLDSFQVTALPQNVWSMANWNEVGQFQLILASSAESVGGNRLVRGFGVEKHGILRETSPSDCDVRIRKPPSCVFFERFGEPLLSS